MSYADLPPIFSLFNSGEVFRYPDHQEDAQRALHNPRFSQNSLHLGEEAGSKTKQVGNSTFIETLKIYFSQFNSIIFYHKD